MTLVATDRVTPEPFTDAVSGAIRWDPIKSIWLSVMTLGGLAAIFVAPSFGGLAVFLVTTSITICAGHSVGMQRLLIHRSFETPKWTEYVLVWLGTLVGMAGPFGMIEAHDMRDWHQRQVRCPDHPAHRAGFWQDAWWQLHCKYVLTSPPTFLIEPEIYNDRFYRWLEKNWMSQQILLAAPLFAFGGVDYLLWGICLRICVSLIGHWCVGHFAHRTGQQAWRIDELPVQGYNLPRLGLITFGENWHGNHHAFPHSARLGIEKGQCDPGAALIACLGWCGLAKNILGPQDRPQRSGLRCVLRSDQT